MATIRNRTGIADAEIRATVDPTFEALHDSLEVAYYQFWKHGRSQPWQGYDVQATPAESKALFDQLHGLIFHHRELVLDAEDQKRPVGQRIPARRRIGSDGKAKTTVATEAIAAATAKGVTIQVR